MEMILGVVAIVFVIAALICAFKESKVTGLYKTFGVYGRWSAYLALDFTFAGPVMAISAVVALIQGEGTVMSTLIVVAVGIALMLLGLFMYWRAYNKCPDILKKKCIISMLITGLGISMKLAVFFLGFVWILIKPQEVVDADGNHLFVISGDVYDMGGHRVGTMTDNNKYVKV